MAMSTSFWGNIRDLLFYWVLGKSIRENMVLHLHVGNLDLLFDKYSFFLKALNRHFLKDIKAVIVLGPYFNNVFHGYIENSKVLIVKNYFDSELLVSEEKVVEKYAVVDKVKILYLSNMIKEKGYELLRDAFLLLPEYVRNKAELHFAGKFNNEQDHKIFSSSIKDYSNIYYHGLLLGEEKKKLFADSHIFCLPTFFKREGQPISILEAYASGCIVFTTANGGINDIFKDGVNGYLVEKSSIVNAEMIRDCLSLVINDICNYRDIAMNNRAEAANDYQISKFIERIKDIVVGKKKDQGGAERPPAIIRTAG
jgi:glycosyltransferase involved in cell wall biosynthesis